MQLQQVLDGQVWANAKYKSDCPHWDEIEKAFNEAKAQHQGIFLKGNAIPPWQWRKRIK